MMGILTPLIASRKQRVSSSRERERERYFSKIHTYYQNNCRFILYKIVIYCDLKSIYLTYVRSILEQSAVVWHSSLTAKNRKDLERVQKSAVRVILGNKSSSYRKDLEKLKLDSLNERRRKICLKFAKKCLLNEKVKNMFPINSSKCKIKTRNRNKYAVQK